MRKNCREEIPTGMGLKILLYVFEGVKALGTKISGRVLNIFTSTEAVPKHPTVSVALTKYRMESIAEPSMATGSAMVVSFNPVAGDHKKESPMASEVVACNCNGWLKTIRVSSPADTAGGAWI